MTTPHVLIRHFLFSPNRGCCCSGGCVNHRPEQTGGWHNRLYNSSISNPDPALAPTLLVLVILNR
jgi:hypothetical protein